jgi:hypothetical protein
MATDNLKKCPVCKKMVPYLEPIHDARGIYVDCTCGDAACEAKVKSKYRADIFTDPQYPTDEQIDED